MHPRGARRADRGVLRLRRRVLPLRRAPDEARAHGAAPHPGRWPLRAGAQARGAGGRRLGIRELDLRGAGGPDSEAAGLPARVRHRRPAVRDPRFRRDALRHRGCRALRQRGHRPFSLTNHLTRLIQGTEMLLKDKVVIVSGIGPGLGVKLAVEAAREGARAVVAAARTSEKLDDAENRIRALGTSCRVLKLPTDITDAGQCRQAAERTVKEFGRIDGLVNSAYFHGDFGPVSEPDFATWSRILDTNLMGSVRMTLAVAPQMKKQGGGAVVMINTMTTLKPFPGEGAYAASKSALLTATKYLAMELGPSNIRVNSARMGWMWGAPVQGYIAATAKAQGVPEQQLIDGVAANIPLRRIVTDDECARAALFLISDYASAV